MTIMGTVCTLFGFLVYVLEWEFGAIQAVGVILFVGLSVDYCLHLSHAFNEAAANSKLERITEALTQLGAAVVGGAVTTIGSVAFLFPCYIYLFVQLGVMIFVNMLLASLFTFFFLAPLLMVAGPSQDFCSIYSCGRIVVTAVTTRVSGRVSKFPPVRKPPSEKAAVVPEAPKERTETWPARSEPVEETNESNAIVIGSSSEENPAMDYGSPSSGAASSSHDDGVVESERPKTLF